MECKCYVYWKNRMGWGWLLSFFVNWCELSSWFGDEGINCLSHWLKKKKKRESNRINEALAFQPPPWTKQMTGGDCFSIKSKEFFFSKGWEKKGANTKAKRNLVCYFYSLLYVSCVCSPHFFFTCPYTRIENLFRIIEEHWETLQLCAHQPCVYTPFISYPHASSDSKRCVHSLRRREKINIVSLSVRQASPIYIHSHSSF